MTRQKEAHWGFKTVRTPSQAVLDPMVRLGFAVVKKAVNDLKEADPLDSLPALCWWIDDAQTWLALLDLVDPDDGSYFDRVIGSCANGRKCKAG